MIQTTEALKYPKEATVGKGITILIGRKFSVTKITGKLVLMKQFLKGDICLLQQFLLAMF